MTVDFEAVLRDFTAAIEAGNGTALAALFTPEGSYHDGFYGESVGRDAIGRMLEEQFWGHRARDSAGRCSTRFATAGRLCAVVVFELRLEAPGSCGRAVESRAGSSNTGRSGRACPVPERPPCVVVSRARRDEHHHSGRRL